MRTRIFLSFWQKMTPTPRSKTPAKPRPPRRRSNTRKSARVTVNVNAKPAPKPRTHQPPRRHPAPPRAVSSVRARAPAGGSARARSLAASLILPHNTPTQRVTTDFSATPTAIATPYFVEQLDWTQHNATTASLDIADNGCAWLAVSRNPLSCIARSLNNFDSLPWSYSARFANARELTDNQAWNVGSTNVEAIVPICPQQLLDMTPGDDTKFHPYGNVFYAFDHAGRKGIHVSPGNEALHMGTAVEFHGLAENCAIVAYLLNGSTWQEFQSYPVLNGISWVIIGLYNTGYYSFDFIVQPEAIATSNNLTMVVRSLTPSDAITPDGKSPIQMLGFLPLPDFDGMSSNVQAVRILGATAMLSQDASVLQKGGRCAGYQLPANVLITEAFGNPVTQFASRPGASQRQFENGIFAFHKPNRLSDLDLTPVVTTTDVGVIQSFYNPVYPPSGWLVLGASVTDVSGSYPGGLAHGTFCFGVEYTTPSTWIDSRNPTTSFRDTEDALQLLAQTPQFHDNPFHISDVWNFIKSRGVRLMKAAGSVANVVGALVPGFSAPAAVVNAVTALGEALS